MLGTIITAVLPMVVTLMIGFFAGWRRLFDPNEATVLNRVVLLFALPMLLFAGMLSTSLELMTRNLAVFVWAAVGIVGGSLVVFALSRFVFRSSAQVAALRALVIAGPNTPIVGVPVLGALYPDEVDLAITAVTLVMNLILIPLVLVFLVGAGPAAPGTAKPSALATAAQSVVKAVKEPVVWAPVLAFLLLLLGFDMPQLLEGSFTMLGQATTGVAMFAAGIILFSRQLSVSVPVIVNVVCKNIVFPAVVLAVMIWFAVPAPERGLVTLSLAIPSAVITVIFAIEYKVGEKEMASTLFFSTILSVLTMGGFIWYLG